MQSLVTGSLLMALFGLSASLFSNGIGSGMGSGMGSGITSMLGNFGTGRLGSILSGGNTAPVVRQPQQQQQGYYPSGGQGYPAGYNHGPNNGYVSLVTLVEENALPYCRLHTIACR